MKDADTGTPVTEVYKVPFMFTGRINKVTVEVKEMALQAFVWVTAESAGLDTGSA